MVTGVVKAPSDVVERRDRAEQVGDGRLQLQRDVPAVVADRRPHVEGQAVLDDAHDRVGDERGLRDLDVEVLDEGELVDDRDVRALRVVDRDGSGRAGCARAASSRRRAG